MRNDIHSPSNFDPAKYSYLGLVYLGDSNSETVENYLDGNETYCHDELIEMAEKSPFSGNFKARHTCDHCGAYFLYGAVYKHENGDVIVVGHQCSYNAFGCNSRLDYDFKRVQNAVAAAKQRSEMKGQADAYLVANPGLEAALNVDHYISKDLKNSLYQWGALTTNQLLLAFKIQKDEADRAAAKAAEDALPKAPVIEGRIPVSGIILGFKEVEDRFSRCGTSWKMLVRDDRGFKLYGSMPLAVCMDDRGKKIEFSATIQKSPRDEFFGFYKRPAKVKVAA